MKPLHYLLLIFCLFVCQTAFAQHKGKKKNQDSLRIQPFPITDIILLPPPESPTQDDKGDYEIDLPDPLLRTDSNRHIRTPEEEKELRVGAICADGTQSTATGRGACAGHGGVKQWIYQDQPKPNLPQLNYKKKKNTSDDSQETDTELPQTSAQPREIYTPTPHPVTSVAEIFGQIAIVILIFLLLFIVIKKVVEKL
jgi:hypothetical protein